MYHNPMHLTNYKS